MATELGRAGFFHPTYRGTFVEGAGFGLGMIPIHERQGYAIGPVAFERSSKGSWRAALQSRSIEDLRQNTPFKYKGSVFSKQGRRFMTGSSKGLAAAGKIAVGGLFMGLGVGFVGKGAYDRYKEKGLFSAAIGVPIDLAIWGAGDVAMKAAWAVKPLAIPLITQVAGGIYAKGQIQKDLQARYRSMPIGMVGDMSAFNTQSAATMREKSARAIQSARMNTRASVLGNEAMYIR